MLGRPANEVASQVHERNKERRVRVRGQDRKLRFGGRLRFAVGRIFLAMGTDSVPEIDGTRTCRGGHPASVRVGFGDCAIMERERAVPSKVERSSSPAESVLGVKNYPNQAADFRRVRNTLETIEDMNAIGTAVLDDADLGYELARRRHYTFRGINYATASDVLISQRIAQERLKSASDQGARTNARELRRTLQGLGWVDGSGIVTALGKDLLASVPGSQGERDKLAQGLMNITATDADGNVSHPVQMMLKLLGDRPSHRRAGLELALENIDDSPAEVARVLDLYRNNTTDSQVRTATGVSESQQRNNRKVFPSLAKYAGLVVEDVQNYFHLTPAGYALIGIAPTSSAVTSPAATSTGTGLSRKRRNFTRGYRRSAGEVGGHSTSRIVPDALTPDQQAAAQNKLNERTIAHQDLVRAFAEAIGDDAGEFWEDPSSFDLIWVPSGTRERYLFEMKTIAADADAQVMRAVGQLAYYDYFNARAALPRAAGTKTLVVDDELERDLCDFLEAQGIGVLVMIPEGGIQALNPLGVKVLDRLPVK